MGGGEEELYDVRKRERGWGGYVMCRGGRERGGIGKCEMCMGK